MMTRLLRRTLTAFSFLSLALIFSTCSFADVTGNSGGDGGAIPDNDSGGYVSTVTITDSEIISEARFTIEGLQHTWIGDLIITVAHSTSGKMATLMHRVGKTSNPASNGFDTNLDGNYTFDTNGPSIWTAAANGDSNFVVPGGTYAASGLNEAVVDLDAIFSGEDTAGTWTFNISDNRGGDVGQFVQTSVAFVSSAAAVPEPGTMGTMIMGALFGGVFFRRRRQKI